MEETEKKNEDIERSEGRRLRKALPWLTGIVRCVQLVYLVSEFVKDWLL